MGRKTTVRQPPRKVPRKARRREQRRVFKKRFKVFFDGEPDSDMDYYENGLEWMLEPSGDLPQDD